MKKETFKTYAFWIVLAEAVGGLSALLTRGGIAAYTAFAEKPPLTPPAVVFPIVWGILFALMGIGAARIALTPAARERSRSFALFFAQLGFNFLWSILFFNLAAYGAAFFWLIALFLLIGAMLLAFRRVDRPAALLQLPYLLWVGFAGYLNFGVWMLNG